MNWSKIGMLLQIAEMSLKWQQTKALHDLALKEVMEEIEGDKRPPRAQMNPAGQGEGTEAKAIPDEKLEQSSTIDRRL